MPLHCTTRHFTTILQLTTLHYSTARLHYTMPRYSTQHYQYTTIHYTNYTAPQLHCNCNCATLITLLYNYNLKLQLHYTTTTTTPTTALHHTTSSSCGERDHCNHCSRSRKHNSNHLSVHQWIRSAIPQSQQPTSPIGLLFLKLPPPPCAVLLA